MTRITVSTPGSPHTGRHINRDRPAIDFLAAHRRWTFDSGKVSKASLLSDADILIDFFERHFEPGETTCPVMIIEGEHDRMVDATEREALRRLYPAAKVITIASSDHFAGILAPPAIMRPLRKFLLADEADRS